MYYMISNWDLRQMNTNNWNTMMVECSDLSWQRHFCKTCFTSLATIAWTSYYVPTCTKRLHLYSSKLHYFWHPCNSDHIERHIHCNYGCIILHLIPQVTYQYNGIYHRIHCCIMEKAPVLFTCPLNTALSTLTIKHWPTYPTILVSAWQGRNVS